MYSIIKKLLFILSPERAHSFSMFILELLKKVGILKLISIKTDAVYSFCGLKFKNRLGMAAGFDKNAEYIETLGLLGFGFVEIGTVTPKAQDGNPKPRLFRLKEDQALMNRMGFNNKGVDEIVENLKNTSKKDILIGGNIGKNKLTPNDLAHEDYLICFEKLYDYVDYFVINVSSPNTPNLRELQEKDSLLKIISTLEQCKNLKETKKPIFLKIAPDLTHNQLDEIIEVYNNSILEALIVSNTTIDYEVLNHNKSFAYDQKMGGISGKPISIKCNNVIQYLKEKDSTIKIIGVGGIVDKKSAQDKIDLGCELLQIYTGFIYKGPKLIKEILAAF